MDMYFSPMCGLRVKYTKSEGRDYASAEVFSQTMRGSIKMGDEKNVEVWNNESL